MSSFKNIVICAVILFSIHHYSCNILLQAGHQVRVVIILTFIFFTSREKNKTTVSHFVWILSFVAALRMLGAKLCFKQYFEYFCGIRSTLRFDWMDEGGGFIHVVKIYYHFKMQMFCHSSGTLSCWLKWKIISSKQAAENVRYSSICHISPAHHTNSPFCRVEKFGFSFSTKKSTELRKKTFNGEFHKEKKRNENVWKGRSYNDLGFCIE